MECPNPVCHEELKLCLRSKISYKTAGTVSLVLISSLVTIFIFGWKNSGVAKDERRMNEKNIEVYAKSSDQRFKNIEKALESIQQNQVTKDKLKEFVNDIKGVIKDSQRQRERR